MPGKSELYYGPDLIQLSDNYISDHPEILTSPRENLYLVNHNRRATSLKHRWLLNTPDSMAFSFPFQSVSEFYARLYAQRNITQRRLSRLENVLILKRILQNNQDNLLYFRFASLAYSPILKAQLYFQIPYWTSIN